MAEIPETLPERLARKIRICSEKGCWLFDGDPSRNGYQRLWYNGSRFMAHIFMWEWATGKRAPVKEQGKTFDHLCERRECCNPEHLDLVPHRINCIRRTRRRKRV